MSRRRKLLRKALRGLAKLLAAVFLRVEVRGLRQFPRQGPALIVTNHLGDADVLVALACFPAWVVPLAKVELYDFPMLGRLMEAYGVIWVHRGQPDRRALRAAIQGLEEGRLIGIAPEGRESLSGSLEEGTGGAAYLALKADVPVCPVTFTGTENVRVYGNLRRLRRTPVTMEVGTPFRLTPDAPIRNALQEGTYRIMDRLASQLPLEYQGVYRRSGGNGRP